MKIAEIAPEVAPFSKTGGLGDVAGALPHHLAELGADVVVVTPLHRSAQKFDLRRGGPRLRVPIGGEVVEAGIATASIPDSRVTVAFIDAYTQMVNQLGVLDTSSTAAAAAPQRNYRTTQATQLRSRAGGGSVLRNLPAGATVYPSGDREGVWWRVTDENENEGWVNNDHLEPLN